MRVLWVSHRSDINGATLSLSEGIKALTARGHRADVVLPASGPLTDRIGAMAEIHVKPHNPWAGARVPMGNLLRQQGYNLLVARRELRRLIVQARPDVVVSNTITVVVGALAAGRGQVPHVWQLCELGSPHHGIAFVLGSRATMRAMRASATGFTANSVTTRDHYTKLLRTERIGVVYPAVEVRSGPESTSRRSGPLRVALVGWLSRGKGQHEAVAAVGELRRRGAPVELTLVGSGDPGYEAELREAARKAGVDRELRFTGFVSDPAVHVRDADVALMCARDEAFGRSTVEAMKLGKPVIGAADGATPELIDPGRTGLLYPPGDIGALASRIEELDRDPGLRKRLGSRARAWACAQFTLEAQGEQLEQALSVAIDLKRRTHKRR